MASIRELARRMDRLSYAIDTTTSELSKKIEKKLGDDWGITQQTDGVCVVCPDSGNYSISGDRLADVLKLDRDAAIEIIKSCSI